MSRLILLAIVLILSACSGPRYVTPADGSTPEQIQLVYQAAHAWNAVSGEVLGVDVFVVAEGDVAVSFGWSSVQLGGAYGSAQIGGDKVWLASDAPDPLGVLTHELGHILGLTDRGWATEEDDGLMTWGGSYQFTELDKMALKSVQY